MMTIPIFKKKAELVQLDISGPMYQVIIIDIDDQYIIMEDLPAKDSEALKKSVLNIASSVIQKHFQCAFCISEFNYFVGLINTKNNATMHIIDVCQQIKEQIQQKLKNHRNPLYRQCLCAYKRYSSVL